MPTATTPSRPKPKSEELELQNVSAQVQDAIGALLNIQESARYRDVKVVREGDKIILPEGMSYATGRKWLTHQEEAEETKVDIYDLIECFPLDGIVAMRRAMEQVYGFTDLRAIDGFWGPEPPLLVQVETPDGFETAPIGNLCPPKWEGGALESGTQGCALRITGKIKRKFESEVKNVLAVTRKLLREQSIYKGRAITIDLSFMVQERKFHPITDAPKFMPLTETEMVLNADTAFELSTSVLMIIERTAACKKLGIPLKHGALFKGPYGTGKTMTAKFIAKRAAENGWTFIYMKDATQLKEGLKLAKLYSPAVVFCEDVDTVTEDRNEGMNELLNVLDGVNTKDTPIVTILTTNNVEVIDPSFLRAGRIDTVIHFGEPDAATAAEFVRRFGAATIAGDADLNAVGEAFKGLVPAFIREAVNKAKSYAVYREGTVDIDGKVVTADLLAAASVMQKQVKLMQKKAKSEHEQVADALGKVNNWDKDEEDY